MICEESRNNSLFQKTIQMADDSVSKAIQYNVGLQFQKMKREAKGVDEEKNVDDLIPNPISSHFIRGLIENELQIYVFKLTVKFEIHNSTRHLIRKWLEDKKIKYSICFFERVTEFTIQGTESFDFLALIYDESIHNARFEHKYMTYFSHYVNAQKVDIHESALPEIKVVKVDPHSIMPSKKRASDVGFDLTVIKKSKNLGDQTALYDTGIIVQPPLGYYIEIVPRSSLSKSGYIQTNSFGIIDPNYLDTLKVALTKIDNTAPDLTFPFTGFQIIFRRYIHCNVRECTPDDLFATSRDKGSFGSTGGLNQQISLSQSPVPTL